MRLDHVSYATEPAHLADTVQRLGAAVGGTFSDGGLHPRFGTRNFVLPLGGGTYVEVVAALDHPAADRQPFGQAVRARAEAGGGWLGWVVAVDDLAPVEAPARPRRRSPATGTGRTASTCAGGRSASSTSSRTRSCRSSCSG